MASSVWVVYTTRNNFTDIVGSTRTEAGAKDMMAKHVDRGLPPGTMVYRKRIDISET